jgi:Histidine kinase
MDAWQLLDIARRLRAADRTYLAGLLHDRPIQDLAAATLELSVARRTAGAPASEDFDVVERLVEGAGRELRSMMEEIGSFARPEPDLAAALERRTARLLAVPLTVAAGDGAAGLAAAEISAVADIVELILLEAGAQTPTQGMVTVRADEHQVLVNLDLGQPPGCDQPSGDPAGLTEWLDGLAAAMQAKADVQLREQRIRVRIALPRPPR